jgi:RND family efflux transporter MFP subunit
MLILHPEQWTKGHRIMERDLSKLSIDRAVREKPGPDRRIIIGASVAVVAIVILALIVAIARRAPEVTVVSARSSAGPSQSAVLNASGYVTPQRRATVSAKTTGKIKEVLIDEGMHVKSGQVLARLDDVDAVATLRAAEAERAVATASLKDIEVRLENARRTLERNRDLRANELVSQQALDDAETAVASLEAQLVVARETVGAAERSVDITRQNVENCVIRAPFEGIIVSKDAQPGEMVSPISAGGGFTRTGIATVVDMNSLEVEVDVNESYIARVTQGQRVETVLDAYPDWRIPSKVRTVIPTADRQKATVKVRITFDKLDPRILPDMGVKVSFLEGGSDSSAAIVVLVPKDAIRRDGEQSYVFVVKDGRVERRAVRTLGERGTDVAVIAGLRQGDLVVVSASAGLRDGERVSVRT